jgi:hypothetical protein
LGLVNQIAEFFLKILIEYIGKDFAILPQLKNATFGTPVAVDGPI